MCQPLLTMKTTVIPCDPKIRYNQKKYLFQFGELQRELTPTLLRYNVTLPNLIPASKINQMGVTFRVILLSHSVTSPDSGKCIR